MFACSIRRAKDGTAFVPEYIIPQMLLQHLIEKNKGRDSVFGIRYIPCYSDSTLKAIGKEYNYVFPIDVKTAKAEEGYSEYLENSFKWTYPRKLSNYNSFFDAESDLKAREVIDSL